MSPDTYADAASWPVFIDPAHDGQVVIDAWSTVYALAALATRAQADRQQGTWKEADERAARR